MTHRRRGLDLHHEALGAEDCSKFWFENFNRDFAIVPEIRGEINRGHAARAELTLDAISVRERGAETFGVRRQHVHQVGRADRGIALRAPRGKAKVSREPN